MSRNKTVLAALLAGIMLSAALAQNAGAQVVVRRPPTATGPTTRPPRVEPCWQVAGVAKSAIQQRRLIDQQTRQEVEAVCANSSLSIQQRRQQIRQIHERQRQEIDGLISPAQQEAMRSCQQQRHAGHGGGGHLGGGHGGPCGDMSVGHKQQPMEEDETPPNQTAKPN
jgi:TolA-binding protein